MTAHMESTIYLCVLHAVHGANYIKDIAYTKGSENLGMQQSAACCVVIVGISSSVDI